MNFEQVILKLRHNEPFHLTRWGDGEFLCMLGAKGHNCDGHEYSYDLMTALVDVWEYNQYNLYGNVFDLVQPHAIRTVEGTESFLKGKQYDSADLFVKASQKGNLGKLFAALKDKYVIFVAPKRFDDWDLFKVSKHIVIPDKNCFDYYNETFCEILNHLIDLSDKTKKKTIILYCASMMSNVLICDNLGQEYITQIDLGSVLEPYIGHSNRKYHTEIIERLK